MKKIFFFLLLASFSLQAQYKIKGELNPPEKYSWIILYKIEGARHVFIKSADLKKEFKVISGKKTEVSNFEFTLPPNTKAGAYRVSYKTEGDGFADFLFNKENISFTFNPENTEETIQFQESKENKLYQEYKNTVAIQQYKMDSLQVAYLKNSQPKTIDLYKAQLSKISAFQEHYIAKSKGLMVHNFIKATNRYNSPTVSKTPKAYLKSITDHFFDTIDFNNSALYNSAFIMDRITDYVFYMNYSEDKKKQKDLYQKAVQTVLEKAKSEVFKKDIMEFLITQFVNSRNIDFADYLMKTYYKKFPTAMQDTEFTASFNEKTVVSIGRTAPEISWEENGKAYTLSTLNDAQNYVLVFWSTGCSHCLREIPVLYAYTQNAKNTKVIAFSLENTDTEWKTLIQEYPKWHNVIGLNKWENPTARTYQIFSTPTYIILDKNKKIIAKPETLDEVKNIIEYLEN
jgi:thiol-disulfide isomerase/thioredoxin